MALKIPKIGFQQLLKDGYQVRVGRAIFESHAVNISWGGCVSLSHGWMEALCEKAWCLRVCARRHLLLQCRVKGGMHNTLVDCVRLIYLCSVLTPFAVSIIASSRSGRSCISKY
jgi:hypothetical protein